MFETFLRDVLMTKVNFTSPLFVVLPRKTKKDRKVFINLNTYRNLHYLVNNQAKKTYFELMESQLKGVVFDKPVTLTFTLHRKDKRTGDRANVLSITEKYFCDALTKYGCFLDDNDNFILWSHYQTGEIDRENPRVDIEIDFI